ncbi:MAG: TVP38/TMEM64 family protein [Promethearchaeia archaeon]
MTEKETNNSFSDKLKDYIKNLFDFSEFDRKTIGYIIIFITLFIVSVAFLYYMYFIDETLLYRLVIELFVNPIFYIGFWGIFLFLAIMTLQGVMVPIPSAIVTLTAGILWGFWGGGILGVIGSMFAATLCYYIAKKGGRPLAEKFVGRSTIAMTDRLIEKYGMGAILITRLIPFISFDAISYTAGIVDLDIKKYSIATFIGSIPRVFFYTWLGSMMNIKPPVNLLELPLNEIEARAREFNSLLLIIVVVISVLFVAYIVYSKYQEKKVAKKTKKNMLKKEEKTINGPKSKKDYINQEKIEQKHEKKQLSP